MSEYNKHEKRRQITFRIGPVAQDKLEQVAALFEMKPTEYAKAILYRDLGVFNEALDQRRRSWRQKKKQLEDEEEAFRGDTNNHFKGLTIEDLKRGKKHKATDMETEANIDSEFDFETDDEEEFRPGRGSTLDH